MHEVLSVSLVDNCALSAEAVIDGIGEVCLKLDTNLDLSTPVHSEMSVGIRACVYISKVFLSIAVAFALLDAFHSVNTEVTYRAFLEVVGNKIILLLRIGKRIGAYLIISTVSTVFFLCFVIEGSVEVLKANRLFCRYRLEHRIYVVVDRLVHVLYFLGNVYLSRESFCLVAAAQSFKLGYKLTAFLFGDETGCLNRIAEQLQLIKLKIALGQAVFHRAWDLYLFDIHAVHVREKLDIVIDTFPLCFYTRRIESVDNVVYRNAMLCIGILFKDVADIQHLELLKSRFCHLILLVMVRSVKKAENSISCLIVRKQEGYTASYRK